MKVDLEKLLETVVETKGSDLHLAVGRPPVVRLHGRLRSLNLPNLTPEDTIELVRSFAPRESLDEMEQVGTSDFAIPFRDKARFRCSIFKERGFHGAALRLIPNQMLSMKQIGLADSIISLLTRPRGLFLVTGPTGSGKTTTLASMINYLNETFDKHIITIEDPIEYHHAHKKSLVMQREIGRDVSGFAEAIRRALRQDPDIVLMGEMRDTETIATAITAAETGHLVFGTLHTTGAARTVDRIIDSFPHEQQEQIRTQLSVSIVAVISQVLMPTVDGKGRVAAFEILVNNSAVENHIRKKETFKIPSVIQTSKKLGMQRLDDHLAELVAEGKITREVAYEHSISPADLALKLGEATPGAAGQGQGG